VFCPKDGMKMDLISPFSKSDRSIYRCNICRTIVQIPPSNEQILGKWNYKETIDLEKRAPGIGIQSLAIGKEEIYINFTNSGNILKLCGSSLTTAKNPLPLDQRHHRISDIAALPDGAFIIASLSDGRLYRLHKQDFRDIIHLKKSDNILIDFVDLIDNHLLFVLRCFSSGCEIVEYDREGNRLFDMLVGQELSLGNITDFCTGDLTKDYFLYNFLDAETNYLHRFDSSGHIIISIDIAREFGCQPISISKIPDKSCLGVACKNPNAIIIIHGVETRELGRIELGGIQPSAIAFTDSKDLIIGEKGSTKIHVFEYIKKNISNKRQNNNSKK
jgi:hypothetical protein